MPTKRFGARYGRKPKTKLKKIEKQQSGHHKCPECLKISVKRQALGIWHCKKCGVTFAGKAYTL